MSASSESMSSQLASSMVTTSSPTASVSFSFSSGVRLLKSMSVSSDTVIACMWMGVRFEESSSRVVATTCPASSVSVTSRASTASFSSTSLSSSEVS